MKQSENPDEFFKKFGFTRSSSRKHPVFKEETIRFEGLEAEYVGRIESELDYMKEAYQRLVQKLDWMTTQEMYRLRDKVTESEHSK